MKLIILSLILAIGATLYSNVEAAGATQCYNCFGIGGCEDASTVQCPDSDETFACIGAVLPPLDSPLVLQGCIHSHDLIMRKLCETVDLLIHGSCKICISDLCNVV